MSEREPRHPRVSTRGNALDQPREHRPGLLDRFRPNPDAFGRMTEGFARFMGTPQFLLWMTVFVALWLGWNTIAPRELQFDSKDLNFTLLTLMLSLQASYAAPLLLLAQNRQDDRDRVTQEEDRRRAQQNLADTEYLTREIASLRIALRDVATRDFVRSELRSVLEEILESQDDTPDAEEPGSPPRRAARRRSRTPDRPTAPETRGSPRA